MNIIPTPAGEMNKRVSLMRRNAGQTNELGETIPSNQEIGRLWVKISPISATERQENAQIVGDVTHEVRTRYTPLIDHTMSLSYHGRILDILQAIDIEEQHIELCMLCHEVKQ